MAGSGDSAPSEQRLPLGRWRIGACILDERLAIVTIDGKPIELDRSSYDVLLALLRHAGEVVTKDELLEAGWPGRVVSENSLAKAISRLRHAMRTDGKSIHVVHGYGYRLTALVRNEPTTQDETSANSAHGICLREGDALPLRPGWHLQQRLGEGSIGVIYLAVSAGDAKVAVKFAGSEIGLRSLKREITLHRYIMSSKGGLRDVAPVLSWNLKQPPYFLEMPYYADGNLHDWAAVRGGLKTLPLAERIAMCADLCETVARLHELGVLHKDLKPANLYPVSDADGTRLVLGDLGAAEATTAPQMAELGLTFSMPLDASGSPSPAGSLLYVAPEVIAGEMATQRSDVYSLGVILFQMCVADLRSSPAPGWEHRIDDPLLCDDIAAAAALTPEERPDARALSVRLRELPARGLARGAQLQLEAKLACQAKALVHARQRRKRWLTLSGALAVGSVIALSMAWQAETARKHAQAISREKQAVVDFFAHNLLAQADPYTSNHSNITLHAAIDNAASTIDRDFASQPDVAVELHRIIADVYDGLTLYQQAGSQLRLAMGDYARSHKQASQAYADLSISLCGALREADDFKNATSACDEGSRLLAKLGAPPDNANLETGKLLFEEGRCREALVRLDGTSKATVFFASAADKIHLRELARDTGYYQALCLQELGQVQRARHAFLQNVRDRRAGWPHTLYLGWVLSDYGYFLVENGQFPQADAALKESHAIFAARLALDDPERYGPEYGFALMRLYEHDWPAAIALMEPIYAAEKKSLGTAHLWPLMTQSDLAWARAESGLPSAASDLDMAMALARPQLAAFGTRASFLVDRWIRASLALHRDELARSLILQQQGLVAALNPHHVRVAMLPCYRAELLRHDASSAPSSILIQEKQCRKELLAALPADHPFVKDVDAALAAAPNVRASSVRNSHGFQ